MCQGDRVIIKASRSDRYRITNDGEWMNVEGDLTQVATDPSLPCNMEGCYVGQLVGKFVTDEGVENVFAVGTEKIFEAPEHGVFSFAINDTTYYDNSWYTSGSIIDHTAIEISPAEGY